MRSICSKTLGFAVSSSSFILWKISSRPSCWDRFLSPWSDLPPIFLYIMAGFLAFVENFRIPRDQFTVNVHLRRALHFVKLCCEENIPFKDKFTQKLRFDHDLRPWVPMESRAKLWSTKLLLLLLFGAEQCCNNWSKWGPVWKCKETNRKTKIAWVNSSFKSSYRSPPHLPSKAKFKGL